MNKKLGLMLMGSLVLGALLYFMLGGIESAKELYQNFMPEKVRYAFWKTKEPYLSPIFFGMIFFILVVEWRLPARKGQKVLSLGLAQDFVWFNVHHFLNAIFTISYLAFLGEVYTNYLGFLTIERVANMATVPKMIFVLFVLDFLKWFHHLVRHKVKWFWYFHTIHHSQTEMNLFENDRVHLFDVLIARTVIFIPGYALGLSVTQLLIVTFLMKWYPYFYHANIKLDMGFLKYILVTPQAHRVHHSKVKKHADKNFGVIFIIWDRLFGTYDDGDGDYPETGIEDKDFPMEKSAYGFSLITNIIKQFVYPFQCIWRDCVQKIST